MAGKGKGKGKLAFKSDKNAGPKRFGVKARLVDMSGVDKFCPTSGKKLPKNGMVVAYEGQFYIDFAASEKAALANG